MFGKNLTSKNNNNKIFRGFRVFEYTYGKKENPQNAGN